MQQRTSVRVHILNDRHMISLPSNYENIPELEISLYDTILMQYIESSAHVKTKVMLCISVMEIRVSKKFSQISSTKLHDQKWHSTMTRIMSPIQQLDYVVMLPKVSVESQDTCHGFAFRYPGSSDLESDRRQASRGQLLTSTLWSNGLLGFRKADLHS